MNEIEVIISGFSLECVSCTINERLNAASTAELRLNKSNLLGPGAINYLDEVIINSTRQKRRFFTGNIVSIRSEPGDQVVMNLNNAVELDETYIRSLALKNIDHREAAYSTIRLGGFTQNRIQIPGLDTSSKELAAFIPFKGIILEKDEVIGKIQLLTLKTIQKKFPGNEENEIWKTFFDADGWLSFTINAPHFAEAEEIAIEKADTFLSAYSSLLQYSYSQFAGDFIEWERNRAAANLIRQNRILLATQHLKSIWLRDFSVDKPNQSKLQLFKPILNVNIEVAMNAEEVSQLPLLVWNRFRDSNDSYLVTLGIWQVFELLSSDVELPKRLTREQRKNLSSRIIALLTSADHLTSEEHNLIEETARKLNQRSLMEKLEEHLKRIDVVLSTYERELLHTFREIRNAIEHGRKPEEPSLQEIKRVKALTNRIILASLRVNKTEE